MPQNETQKYSHELLGLAKEKDEAARSKVVSENMGLVMCIARRFFDRGVEREDIIQIGTLGLLRAIDTFDAERGFAFSTYAVPMIMGEIRRYLRDDGQIKVGRKIKSDGIKIMHELEKFREENGRDAHIGEIAKRCSLDERDAAMALEALMPVYSIDAPISDDDGFSLENLVSGECDLDKTSDSIALWESIGELSKEDRAIIYLRYVKDYSQAKAAQILNLTQVKISRREKKIFDTLRKKLG